MNRVLLFISFTCIISTCFGSFRTTQIIDSWGNFGITKYLALENNAPPAESMEFSLQSNNAIGGERNIFLSIEEGSIGAIGAIIIKDNTLIFAGSQEMEGNLKIQYDGKDESLSINNNNHFDLTLNGGDRFRIQSKCDIGATIILNVYAENKFSTTSISIAPRQELKNFFIPFSKLIGNVDFSDVTAIEIVVPFEENLDILIGTIDIIGTSSPDTFEFVAPLENEYIDYETGCVKNVNYEESQTEFSYFSSSSSSSVLLPSVVALFFVCLSLC